MESLVEPVQDSTLGETRVPRLVHRSYMSFFLDGVPPKINCHIRACTRGKHVSLEVLAGLGSTIASMKALDHSNTPLLPFSPDEVPVANKQR